VGVEEIRCEERLGCTENPWRFGREGMIKMAFGDSEPFGSSSVI
jgi:hypothetical protein